MRATWGALGFVGQGGTQAAVSLEGYLGRVEARSEATFEKTWPGSLVFTWSLLSPTMDMD